LKGSARKGVVDKVMFHFAEPLSILVSILHLEINLVNDLFQYVYDFAKWSVECWENELKVVRDAYLEAHEVIHNYVLPPAKKKLREKKEIV
jgi:hypothetical protein